MFKFNDEKGQLKCSFCGKTQDQVRKLVAGPGVYICDECIELCTEIVEEELGTEEEVEFKDVPKPKEIREILDEYVIGQDQAKSHFLLPYTIIINGLIPTARLMMSSYQKAIYV